MKKRMALLMTMMLTIGALAGCGESAPDNEASDKTESADRTESADGTEVSADAEDDGEKVTVTIGLASCSPEELELRDRQIAALMEKYPNINLEVQPVTGDYMQWLQTSASAGVEPDIVSLGVPSAAQCYDADLLEPLTSYIEASGTDLDDYEENILAGYNFDGDIYCLPRDFNTLVMIYNEDMLNDAGLTVPTTWEELEVAAEKLTTGDVTALCLANDEARFTPFLRMAGGSVVDENGNPTFVSDENAEGLGFYYSFIQNGTAKTPEELGVSWNAEALAQGKTGIIFEGGWAIPFLTESAPDMNWKIAPLPAGPNGVSTFVFDGAYAITKNSKVKEEAFKVIEFMTGPEASQMMAETGLAIPASKSANAGYVEKYPERAAVVESVAFAEPWFYGKYTSDISTALNHAGEALAMGAITDPKEALETYEKEVAVE